MNMHRRPDAYKNHAYVYMCIIKCTYAVLSMFLACLDQQTSNSKSMPTRALSGIHEVILRNPEGLRNITECIPEKACRRHALTSLYPGYEIITR